MSEINRMNIKEFRELGYLQEVNRRFLHPLGLALEVIIDENGDEKLNGVWDYRDDLEGIYYTGIDLKPKAAAIKVIEISRRATRINALGYYIQPPE